MNWISVKDSVPDLECEVNLLVLDHPRNGLYQTQGSRQNDGYYKCLHEYWPQEDFIKYWQPIKDKK